MGLVLVRKNGGIFVVPLKVQYRTRNLDCLWIMEKLDFLLCIRLQHKTWIFTYSQTKFCFYVSLCSATPPPKKKQKKLTTTQQQQYVFSLCTEPVSAGRWFFSFTQSLCVCGQNVKPREVQEAPGTCGHPEGTVGGRRGRAGTTGQPHHTVLCSFEGRNENVDSFMMDRTLLRSGKMFLYLGMHHLAGFIETPSYSWEQKINCVVLKAVCR